MMCQHCNRQPAHPCVRLRQEALTPWADANKGILFRGYYWCSEHRRFWASDSAMIDQETAARDADQSLQRETDYLYALYTGRKTPLLVVPAPAGLHLRRQN